jgi:hypothetical protein
MGAEAMSPAVPYAMQYKESSTGFVIELPASGVTVKKDPGQILLTFDTSVPKFDLQDFATRARPWLTGVNVGYDALLLIAPKAHIEIAATQAMLRIILSDPVAVPDDQQNADTRGARRLAILQAQLQLRDGNLTEARRQFTALHAQEPNNPDAVSGLASVQREAGRWGEALALAKKAEQLSGGTVAYSDAVASIQSERASRAGIDAEYLRVSGGQYVQPISEDLVRFYAFIPLEETWRFGASVDALDISSGPLQTSDGSFAAFHGHRQRVELDLEHESRSGLVVDGSLFESRGAVGGALALKIPDDAGATRFGLDARRPYWDVVEALVDGTLRDRLWLSRWQRLAPQALGQLELGFNRYDLLTENNVARAICVAGELRQDGLFNIAGFVATYHLDAEYFQARTAAVTANGVGFFPLPLQDREVHSLTLGYVSSLYGQPSGARLTFDGYAGFAKDRRDGSGPVAAVTMSYSVRHFDIRVRAAQLRGLGEVGTVNRTVAAKLLAIF